MTNSQQERKYVVVEIATGSGFPVSLAEQVNRYIADLPNCKVENMWQGRASNVTVVQFSYDKETS